LTDHHYSPHDLVSMAKQWPTPMSVPESEASHNQLSGQFRRQMADAREVWATPRTITGGAESAERKQELGRADSGGGDLQSQAQLWQTPATDSFRSRGGDRKDEMGLDQQARFFPTPAAREYRSPNLTPDAERRGTDKGQQLQNFVAHSLPVPQTPDGQPSSEPGQTSRQRLNPRFVEWLMGFPPGWTEL
jgi:hypothetical protein